MEGFSHMIENVSGRVEQLIFMEGNVDMHLWLEKWKEVYVDKVRQPIPIKDPLWLDKEVESLDEGNFANFEDSNEKVFSPTNKWKRNIDQEVHHQVKKTKTIEDIDEGESTVLCTPDPQLPSAEVRNETENQEDEGSKVIGLNEEELTDVNNFVAKAIHFAENALVADKDIYSLGLGFTESPQH